MPPLEGEGDVTQQVDTGKAQTGGGLTFSRAFAALGPGFGAYAARPAAATLCAEPR